MSESMPPRPRQTLLRKALLVSMLAFSLVAGSASARRATVPMPALVDALRRDRGAEWQPAPAYLSTAAVLAGDAALVAPPEPRDWKAWLLWGVLLLGAGLVAAFAFSLLRGRPPA